jgi:arylsulfatase A-like enzyme
VGRRNLAGLHIDKPPSAAFLQGFPWWQLEVLQHLYNGAIHQADAAVQHVVEGLRRAEARENTLVVVTADHGEGFGEVSDVSPSVRLIDHSWGIDEELTHLPLVVKHPGQNERQDVDEPATLRRFPRTAESVLEGYPEQASFVPRQPVLSSTYRLLESQRGFFEGSKEDSKENMGSWRAVYEETGGEVRKYAVHGDEDVVQVVRSAQERHVVAGDAQIRVEEQFGALERWEFQRSERRESSEAIKQRLADLGSVR